MTHSSPFLVIPVGNLRRSQNAAHPNDQPLRQRRFPGRAVNLITCSSSFLVIPAGNLRLSQNAAQPKDQPLRQRRFPIPMRCSSTAPSPHTQGRLCRPLRRNPRRRSAQLHHQAELDTYIAKLENRKCASPQNIQIRQSRQTPRSGLRSMQNLNRYKLSVDTKEKLSKHDYRGRSA